MSNLNRLNEVRHNIQELCGSDAHSFLHNLVSKSGQRSRLISTEMTSSGLDHSKLSSDSIPDLVNTDFETSSNLKNDDKRIDQQLQSQQQQQQQQATTRDSPSQPFDQKGLETSSSFDKYSLVEETTTANEESNMTCESIDTNRNFYETDKPKSCK